MLGLAYGQKSKLEDLDAQWSSGHYTTERCTSLTPDQCTEQFTGEREDITDKGKLYVNLIFLYVGGVFIVPAIVAVVVGHPFAKEVTERPVTAKEKVLESMRVALVPSERETTLLLSISF
jgi:hypothetical protein